MIYYITRQIAIDPQYQVATVDDMMNYFTGHDEIQIDSETQGPFNFKNEMLLLQIGDKYEINQYVINFQELTTEERNKVGSLLSNPAICKLFHNSKFDIKFLWFYGFDIVNIYDTMLGELILNAGRDTEKGFYSLYGCAKRYCNVTLNKEERGNIMRYGISTASIKYAADDVVHLSKIKELQIAKMRELDLAREDIQDIYSICGLEMNAIIVFASIEYNGMKLDVNKWSEIKREVHEKVKDAVSSIDTIVNNEPRLSKFTMIYQDLFTPAFNTTVVNWSSATQKLKVLKELFPDIEATGERELSRYKNKHPIVKALLEYNKAKKLATAFADKLEGHINPVTKRIHPDIWPMVSTGRISCKDPNLLQIPSRTEIGGKMRKCFVAESGNKIVGGDYSGFELKVITEFSQDPVWVNTFKENKDLHSELCSRTFGIPIENVRTATPFKPDLIYRDVQKTINFGLAYGMSEHKLADTIEVPIKVAKDIIDKFFSIVPKVKQFLDLMGYLAKTRGFIRTPLPYRRIRWFDGWNNTDDFKRQGAIERAGKNSPIQGCNADVIKLALITVYNEIKTNNYPVKIIGSIYDEIQTECKEEFAEQWAKIMTKLMIEAAAKVIKTIPVEVDCKVSSHWKK